MSARDWPRKLLLWMAILISAAVLFVASCDTAGKACETDLVCTSGQICLLQKCTPGCRTSFACPTGTFCFENQCGPDACTPGKSRSCYSGKEGTLSIGTCRTGLQYCDDKGRWSLCSGELKPQEETCDREDNDCNGQIDDGINCECTPGDQRECYTGPKNTLAKGRPCKAGVQACLRDRRWGKCRDQRLPLPEVCGIQDNDCDGKADNDLTCGCQEGATRACYDGPQNTAGSGICKAGKQTCTDNKWSVCEGAVLPVSEDPCNGIDDDCNGLIDDAKDGKTCGGEVSIDNRDAAEPAQDGSLEVPAPGDKGGEQIVDGDGGGADLSLPEFPGDGVVAPLGVTIFKTTAGSSVWPRDITVDKRGNVYIVGHFVGKLFPGTKHELSYHLAAPGALFVAKWSPKGVLQWSVQTIGALCKGNAIAVNDKEEVFITGSTQKDGNRTVLILGQLQRVAGVETTFVAKLDSSGKPVRLVNSNATSGENAGQDIVLHNNQVYVAGHFQKTIEFSGARLSSGGARDISIFVFDQDLVVQQERFLIGGLGEQQSPRIAAESTSGLLYVSGQLSNTARFPGGVKAGKPGQSKAFIVEIDPKTKKSKPFVLPCDPSCVGRGLAVGGGAVALTGHYIKNIKGKGGKSFSTNDSLPEMFVARLKLPFANTPLLDALSVSVTPTANAPTSGVDAAAISGGRTLVVGNFRGAMQIETTRVNPTQGDHVFAATFDAMLGLRDLQNTQSVSGGNNRVVVGALVSAQRGLALIVGHYGGEVDIANTKAKAVGTQEMFLVKLQIAP